MLQELLPCLKEMDLPLTADQVAKPNYSVVRAIYELLVTTLLGLTRQVAHQHVMQAAAHHLIGT